MAHRDAVAAAVATLRAGGVIAAPTETVYGLMTLWDNARGRDEIYRLKRRPESKLLQMLAADTATACRHGVVVSPALDRLAAAFWPGPLTVVADADDGSTIGLRIPGHLLLQDILRELGAPLAATSANLSGRPPGTNALEAVAELDGTPDLLVDGGPVPPNGGTPSTVASITGGQLRILRPGPISEGELRSAFNTPSPRA